MPRVPAVPPAVKVTEEPLPLSEPSALLVRAQTYEMLPGQVVLHVGVAVNSCGESVDTVGVVGLNTNEFSATTVMIVDVTLVTLLSVALT
jgi:hypothetical protein